MSITGVGGVELASDSVTRINAGSNSVMASISDPNYYPASGTATIDIAKAPSTTVVTINGGPFTYTGLAQTPATVSVTGVGLNLMWQSHDRIERQRSAMRVNPVGKDWERG